jgi:hypothetical protein
MYAPTHFLISLGRFEHDRKTHQRIKRPDAVRVDTVLDLPLEGEFGGSRDTQLYSPSIAP